VTALAKTDNAEVSAMAHAAHTFSRLSVRNLKSAETYPRHREECLSEAHRLRSQANHYLAWARREKAHSRAQALPVLAALNVEPA
jgi:hypothetical protein